MAGNASIEGPTGDGRGKTSIVAATITSATRAGLTVKTGRTVPVPDGAQFFRQEDSSTRLAPITAMTAQCGDIVVLPDHRAGTYLGAGSVLLEGGEWATLTQLLPQLVETELDGPTHALDPLALTERRKDN